MNVLAITLGSAAAAGIGALVQTSLSATSQFWGGIHSRASSDAYGYALTFDDGPTDPSTPAILDILADLGVKATFFVVGENVRRRPELLARIHAEGHLIGNHSLNHAHLGLFGSTRYWDRQLRQTDDIIERIIGVRPALFRPPMGIKTPWLMAAAARQGHAIVTWSRRGRDGVTTSPGAILNRIVPQTQNGDVVVLHDGIEPDSRRDPSATIAALRPLIQRLGDRGLEPVRLDQLLGLAPYVSASLEAAAA